MPTLANAKHERFARLLVQGVTPTEAVAKVYPEATRKSCAEMASRLKKSMEISSRVAEMREIVDSQFALDLGAKRDTLRRMIAGEIPTKVIRRTNGKVEAIFDRLEALKTDAKIAGEMAGDNVLNINSGPTLKLDFHVLGRNTSMTPALEAEWQELIDPKPRELPETPPDQEDDFTLYEQMEPRPGMETLAEAGNIIDVSTDSEASTE